MPGRIEFESGLTRAQAQPRYRRRGSGALRILVLGDLSGRDNRGLCTGLQGREPLALDLDNLAAVQRRLAPELRLPLGEHGPLHSLGLPSLESFRPESLLQELAPLRGLMELRGRLRDPAGFESALAELGAAVPARGEPTADPGGASAVSDEAPGREGGEADEATLARLLGRASATPSTGRDTPASPGVDLGGFIRALVSPHVSPAPHPGQGQYLQAVDAALAGQLSGLLHHPDLQALEAAWRGLHELITGLEGEGQVQVAVLDAGLAELALDLEGEAQGALGRRLTEPEAGVPWSLLVGLYRFGEDAASLQLLGRLGELAGRAGAPFLAGAADGLLGGDSAAAVAGSPGAESGIEPGWQALRRSTVAPWLGLAWPRLLLRLPYGARTDPVEGLGYEELPAGPEHGRLLWGHPALACALLIGRAFEARGWEMSPGDALELADRPAYVYEQDGLARLYPCAETYLSERAMEAVLGRGVMPLVGFRDRNAVRVGRFQSIADPPRALAGPWK